MTSAGRDDSYYARATALATSGRPRMKTLARPRAVAVRRGLGGVRAGIAGWCSGTAGSMPAVPELSRRRRTVRGPARRDGRPRPTTFHEIQPYIGGLDAPNVSEMPACCSCSIGQCTLHRLRSRRCSTGGSAEPIPHRGATHVLVLRTRRLGVARPKQLGVSIGARSRAGFGTPHRAPADRVLRPLSDTWPRRRAAPAARLCARRCLRRRPRRSPATRWSQRRA